MTLLGIFRKKRYTADERMQRSVHGKDVVENLEAAITEYRQALGDPGTKANPSKHRNTLGKLGLAHLMLANEKDAESNSLEALRLFDEVLGLLKREESPDQYINAKKCQGEAHEKLSSIRDEEGHLTAAIDLTEEAIRALEELLPGERRKYRDLFLMPGMYHLSLASKKKDRHHAEKAFRRFEEALRPESGGREEPADFGIKLNVAVAAYTVTALEHLDGNIKAAVEPMKTAIRHLTQLIEMTKGNPFPGVEASLLAFRAHFHRMLALGEDREANLKAALDGYREALKAPGADMVAGFEEAVRKAMGEIEDELAGRAPAKVETELPAYLKLGVLSKNR